MTVKIARALYESYDGDFEELVAQFEAAIVLHRDTEGVPAPMAPDALVEMVARQGGFVIVEPPPEPPQVVQPATLDTAITAPQLRLWLLSQGVTGAMVGAQIATLPGPMKEVAAIRWEYSTRFERADPLVALVGAALGMSPEQIDAGWIEASQL